MNDPILEILNLSVTYPLYQGIFQKIFHGVRALENVELKVFKGETLGIVGESGSGKSTLAKAITVLLPFISKDIKIQGQINITKGGKKTSLLDIPFSQIKPFRKMLQMIFQDPFSSLNPRMTVFQILKEPLDIHQKTLSRNQKTEKIKEMLRQVGLNEQHLFRFPHEFSGGQRQRISFARALIIHPSIIIADEPVSALDVSIQAQIINLMQSLQQKLKLTYIFIAHDLSLVKHISTRIAIMYLGHIVEIGNAHDVYHNPKHPYSQVLISSIPVPDPEQKNRKRIILKGEVPSPLDKPSGCPFRTRCPICRHECSELKMKLLSKGPDHVSACPYA